MHSPVVFTEKPDHILRSGSFIVVQRRRCLKTSRGRRGGEDTKVWCRLRVKRWKVTAEANLNLESRRCLCAVLTVTANYETTCNVGTDNCPFNISVRQQDLKAERCKTTPFLHNCFASLFSCFESLWSPFVVSMINVRLRGYFLPPFVVILHLVVLIHSLFT